MSKWNDTNTTLRDESTFSEDVITSEEDMVVSTNMDADERDVNTSNLGFSEDTNFEPLMTASRFGEWQPRGPFTKMELGKSRRIQTLNHRESRSLTLLPIFWNVWER